MEFQTALGWGDLKDHFVPHPCHHIPLDQGAHSPIQPGLGLAIPDSLLGFASASEQEAVNKGRCSHYHFEFSSPKLIPAANTEIQLLSFYINPLVLISFFQIIPFRGAHIGLPN